jgi:hypothetical protein
MNNNRDDDARALGLAGAIAGDQVPVPQLDRRLGEGLVAQPATSLQSILAGGLQNADFLHVRLRALHEVGLSLHAQACNQRVLKLSSLEGSPIEVVGQPRAWERDAEDPGTVLMELGDARVGVVCERRRCGAMIEADGRSVTQVFLPLADEPFKPLRSEAEPWAGSDAWLASCVRQRIASGDPIGHAVAVGLIKRLAKPSQPAIEVMTRLLDGEPVEELQRSHLWMRALDGAQQRAVERLACDRAAALAVRLGGAERIALQDLRERDDLEGVRVLLREMGAGQRLDRALAIVDRIGLRPGTVLDPGSDPQIERARGIDGLAWWARREDA